MEDFDLKGYPEPRAARAVLVEALRDAIERGAIPPGTPLRQDQLAAQFKVSHIPVREALQELVSEGLGVLVHNKGVVVSQLSVEEAAELTEYRCLLEVQLSHWAVPRLSKLDFERARQVLDELDRTRDIDVMLRLNAEFHAVIYRRAERPFFLKAVENVRVNLGRYWRLAWLELGHKLRSQYEHRRILRLCEQRKAKEVGELIERHIRTTGALIVEYLRRRGAESSQVVRTRVDGR